MTTRNPGGRAETWADALPAWLNWRSVVLGALVLVLVYQIVVPILMVVWTSLKVSRPGEPEFLALDWTIANYARAYLSADFWTATVNTIYFAGASTAFAFTIGAFLAWVVERTNTPMASFIGMVTLGRIIIPGVLITVSWVLIASPSIGIANHIFEAVTGISKLFNIYTFWGMVWIQTLEMVPLAYLLLAAAFKAMDPRLEEASTMTGAGTWRTMRRISLPLVMPAVGASTLLLFITTIEGFEVPLFIGGRAEFPVYATEVFFNTARTPVDWGLSSTYAVAMLVLSVLLLVAYFRLLRHGERYQTITGKDYRPNRIDLGRWRFVTCGASLLLVFLVTGVPFLTMLYASFLDNLEPPTLEAFASMSLANYESLLEDTHYSLDPMVNSTLLGLGTATVVMLLAAAISYFVHKTEMRGRKALDYLTFAAIAIPSVVLGVAFLWQYLLIPLPIIGSLLVIGLAYLTKYLPYALRFVSTSMVQIHSELEEAAAVAGVPWWKNFIHIFLPLLKPGLMAGWFWVMVHAYRELTIALMLARADNRTAAVIIFDLWDTGSFMELSAFGVMMFALLIVLVWVSHAISKHYGVKEQA